MGVYVVLSLLAVFNVYASWVAWRREPDEGRKKLQIALVWVVPLVGAITVSQAHAKWRLPERSKDPNYNEVHPP